MEAFDIFFNEGFKKLVESWTLDVESKPVKDGSALTVTGDRALDEEIMSTTFEEGVAVKFKHVEECPFPPQPSDFHSLQRYPPDLGDISDVVAYSVVQETQTSQITDLSHVLNTPHHPSGCSTLAPSSFLKQLIPKRVSSGPGDLRLTSLDVYGSARNFGVAPTNEIRSTGFRSPFVQDRGWR